MGWFSSTLSLESEASLACDRQRLKALTPEQLQRKADEWVGMLYTQRTVIDCQPRRIQELEIAIATGAARPMDHLALAREIEAQLHPQQMREPLRRGNGAGLV